MSLQEVIKRTSLWAVLHMPAYFAVLKNPQVDLAFVVQEFPQRRHLSGIFPGQVDVFEPVGFKLRD